MSELPNYAAYLRRISPDGAPRALLEMMGADVLGRAATESFDLAGAVEAARDDRMMSGPQISAIEALIHPEIRPVFDVRADSYAAVKHPLWQRLNEAEVRARVEAAIRASGRIELSTGSMLYGGTGFVVGDGLLMTNRHVAELFANGLGDRDIVFKPGYDPGFDLKRERGGGAGPRLAVRRVRLIHPYWDCALLEVEGLPAEAGKLLLSGEGTGGLADRDIALVGYPAEDPRNPAEEQDDVMDGAFRVKRLAPGKLSAPGDAESFGKLVLALGHDASTLGGNSGSALVDLGSGHVLGLHFGGVYRVRNTAAAAADLAADPRLHDAGVNFEGKRPARAPSWSGWWNRAFAGEAPVKTAAVSDTASATPVVTTLPAGGATLSDGGVRLTIPLHITVRLGSEPAPPANAQAGTEAMVEPWRERDYAGRGGYDPAFLDPGGSLVVPPPAPNDSAVLAPTTSGDTVLRYQNFSIAMHAKRRLALCVASNVTGEPGLRRPDPRQLYTRKALSGLGENDQEAWFLDDRMDSGFQVPDYFYTRDGGNFDRGHVARRDDVAHGKTYAELRRANGDSYHVTNCTPQVKSFNRATSGTDNWGDFENVVLSQAGSERLCVFAGPVLDDADPWFLGKAAPCQRLILQIPTRFWKVVVARAGEGLATYALLLEQDLAHMPPAEPLGSEEFVLPETFVTSLVRLKDIESWTGLAFGKALHDVDQYFTGRGVTAATIVGATRQRRKKRGAGQ